MTRSVGKRKKLNWRSLLLLEKSLPLLTSRRDWKFFCCVLSKYSTKVENYAIEEALHFFHHPFRVVVAVVGGRLPTCSQLMSLSQLALVKMQSLHKCVGVSGSLLHSLHSVSCGQSLFAKLSTVKIFFFGVGAKRKNGILVRFWPSKLGGTMTFWCGQWTEYDMHFLLCILH